MAIRYLVYQVKFKTRCGTVRIYIGYTKALDVRSVYHDKEPNVWLLCKDTRGLTYKVLEEDIDSLELALGLEAMHAARAIAAEPLIARGGPWSRKLLTPEMLQECQCVAPIRSLMQLKEVAEAKPGGRLDQHLRDLVFLPAAEAPAGAPTTRGACIVKRRKHGSSGTQGNEVRKLRAAKGTLKKPSAAHTRSHRGIDYAARRAVEQANRPSRPRVMRRPSSQ
jgi:hypothetical protein